jgi:colanic acid biosynthesis glycosyl transferase WcaI
MYYYPEPLSIPHDLATELMNRGHSVTVITGFPNYPTGKIYTGYRMKGWQWEIIDGINVLRIPYYINRGKTPLRRILSYLSFTVSATLLGLLILKRPDVIWTYQVGLPGVTLSALKRAPLIHEVQDLWPEWGQSESMGMKTWLYKILDRQERFIYRAARAIITISNGFQRILMAKNVPLEKIHVIPNWANEQNFRPVPRDLMLGESEKFTNNFNIVYMGNIGTAQGLDVVLSAAKQLSTLTDLHFVLIGDGVDRERLAQKATAQGLANIRFLGSRPQDQAADYLAWAEVVLIHLKNDPMYSITIPSKTYAYMACGRPILAAATGDVANLVSELGVGIVCVPESSDALVTTIRRLYDMDNGDREKLGKMGREMFETKFTRQILVNQYEMLFESVSRKHLQSRDRSNNY